MTLGKSCFLQATPILETLTSSRSSTFSLATTKLRKQNYIVASKAARTKATTPKRNLCTANLQQDQKQNELLDELSTVETFRVTEAESGKRIDKLITDRFHEKSRTYIQSLLAQSCVTIDQVTTTAKSFRPEAHQVVNVTFLPTERELPFQPEDLPLQILHEDAHLLVVNKPSGMVVHPAPGNRTGTLVHTLCFHYPDIAQLGGRRPGIVHRLDKGTTGALVIARTHEVAAALSALFAARAVRKEYIAITVGNPCGTGCDARSIQASIARSPTDRLRMAVVPEDAGGREAHSAVEVLASDSAGLLHATRIRISTGRTHQIRVHMRHVRAPVLGDDLYGAFDINRRFAASATRPMLHARCISFRHPVTDELLEVSAPLPDDLASLLRRVVYPDFEKNELW